MNRRNKMGKRDEIHLRRFGSVTGLNFEDGGSAEMLMTFPEVSRILKAWLDHERKRHRPDEKTVSALSVLSRKVYKFKGAIVADVPIAQRRAKIVPVVGDDRNDPR